MKRHAVVRSATLHATLVLSLLLAGCGVIWPRVQVEDNQPPLLPEVIPQPAEATGSIYRAASYRPLFEDHRARHVGDTLVVQIVEKISASQSSTSSVDKKGGLAAGVTALPGMNAGKFGRANIGATGTNSFEGKGATESSNDFSGTITVVVRGVLPNGHLLIAGEKQIGVNENVDVLRFSGQVDPRAIQSGNAVPSAQIANVRLEHRGRGQQAEAQAVGWLSRVFLSLAPV
ncbi:flagellar protein of basal-body outer-membrane L ring [Rubrivivax sp. A210]|uniref:flagellar basal body L-ring protein FlgH n=1 Tax=Rubrivivax sp. A210 TaxID=2772301 RepID=UPI001917D9A7|nr:flagellar basal body L-ring protein FlgH [Rubrivivax sp. A210]CAD5374743.1 flagellar protein of basal-body outer-membrane L ring [Rubrivivax sp. A210]